MKEINNERFQESYVEEVLDNGLRVILWNKKGFEKSFFMMATPLGGLDLNQVDEQGKQISFPAGIAHFLEHKMFENENVDVMDVFSSMGANVNAFTSYGETAYYFSTTANPIEPLHLLLDFVQELNISEESVEKEKGIITQELEMYQQMSEVRLINETLSSLYHSHPLIYDIGGDIDSVNSITKQQLEDCYTLNYHPSKMILVGVTALDAEEVMKEIKDNQSKKSFTKVNQMHRKVYVEQSKVAKQQHQISMDISIPKVNVAFKLDGIKDPNERNKKEWSYKLLLDIYFSSLHEEYQRWLDEEIINTSFSFEIDFGEDYGLLMFYTETNKEETFQEMIFNTLRSIQSVDEGTLNQLKNRYFGMSVNALQDQKQIAVSFMRNYFAGLDFFASIEAIEEITCQDLMAVLNEINDDNFTKVTILPKKV